MEAEAPSRAAADGLTERTFSRVLSVSAVAIVVAGVVTAVVSTGASVTAKNLGVMFSVGSGVALIVFGFVGRGSLVVPVWLLAVVSALFSVSSDGESSGVTDGSSRVLRAGLLGLAIVAAAVASQYASDRRFATPIAPGQRQMSALTLIMQLGSATLGLVSVLAAFAGDERVAYGWFFAGAAGLFSLLGLVALGLRRP